MKRFGKYLCLWFAFTAEVRIHAQSAQLPEHCLTQRSFPCALSFERAMTKKAVHGFDIAVASGSVLLFEGPENLRMVRGQAWIKALTPTEVSSPYVRVRLNENDEIFLSRIESGLVLRALSGQVILHRRGISTPESLTEGFETQVGPMRVGFASVAWPQVYNWAELTTSLARFYSKDQRALDQKLTQLRPIWQKALVASADLSQQAATRSIAQAKADEAQRQARARVEATETARLNKMFRERYFNP
jgi:hypothetical protein